MLYFTFVHNFGYTGSFMRLLMLRLDVVIELTVVLDIFVNFRPPNSWKIKFKLI